MNLWDALIIVKAHSSADQFLLPSWLVLLIFCFGLQEPSGKQTENSDDWKAWGEFERWTGLQTLPLNDVQVKPFWVICVVVLLVVSSQHSMSFKHTFHEQTRPCHLPTLPSNQRLCPHPSARLVLYCTALFSRCSRSVAVHPFAQIAFPVKLKLLIFYQYSLRHFVINITWLSLPNVALKNFIITVV